MFLMPPKMKIAVRVLYPPLPKEIALISAKLKALCSETSQRRENLKIHNDKYCSRKDCHCFVLAFAGPKLVGRVIVLTRQINIAGSRVFLGGIGGVCTHPKYQGQGIASTLLKKGMRELYRQKCDIAYLCTDIDNPMLVHLYQKFGFRVLGKPYTYEGKSGKRYISGDGMIAPLRSEKMVSQVLASKTPLDIGVGNW